MDTRYVERTETSICKSVYISKYILNYLLKVLFPFFNYSINRPAQGNVRDRILRFLKYTK